jgi:hypothetical protein
MQFQLPHKNNDLEWKDTILPNKAPKNKGL